MTWKTVRRALFATLFVALVAAENAQAGKYHDYTCRTPSGAEAPADGWSGSTTGLGVHAENTCGTGGALIAGLAEGTTHSNGDQATWKLTVPSPEKLTAATLWRANRLYFRSGEHGVYQAWIAGPSETSIFDECIASYCSGKGEVGTPFAASNELAVPGSHLGTNLYVNASCFVPLSGECGDGFDDPNGYVAAQYLYAANLVLEQSEGPTVKEVSGPLATEKAIHGTSDLTFNATDPGAGVYQAIFTVDGSVVQETVINENSGHCKNVGGTTDGLPAFLYLQPCLKSVSGDVGLETTKLSNGRHHIVVTVTDPAGNVAYALDREVEVFNPTGPIGFFWRVAEAELATGASREFTAEVGYDFPLMRLKGQYGSTEVDLQGTQLTASHAVITGGKPGKTKETFTLEDVTVTRPKKCDVSGGIIATHPLAGELVQATNEAGTESGSESVIVGPAEGSVFADVELVGSKCGYKGDVVALEGSTVATIYPHEELKSFELGFHKMPAIRWYRNSKGELLSAELKIGAAAATWEGGAEMTLVSGEHFGAF